MRVSYRCAGRYRDGAPVYEQTAVTHCCGEMKRRWGSLIAFGVPGHPRTTDRAVNLCSAVPQAGNRAALSLVPVDFCPWCGAAIEACRVK
jgi:hypothetical protein